MAQIVRTPSRVAHGASAALLLTLLLAGCDQRSTDPGLGTPAQFSRAISLPDLHTQLTSGPARVDVRVMPGGLIARRIEIKGADEMKRPEEIRSRVTAISASGDHGTVTLALGGLQVGFTASTTFRPDDGKGEDGGSMALADFVARVQAELAAGSHPAVKAQRSPPTQPQAPGDAAFTATQLKLDHEADHPVIKLNITADNLITNQTPPPDLAGGGRGVLRGRLSVRSAGAPAARPLSRARHFRASDRDAANPQVPAARRVHRRRPGPR